MRAPITLVLGGARAGKSACAERIAAAAGRPVLFLATARAGDAEMAARIARHRAERPRGWRTVEEPEALAAAIGRSARTGELVLLDCLTLWVSNLLARQLGDGDLSTLDPSLSAAAERHALAGARELLAAARRRGVELVVVSNEVGLGVVPPTALGRLFQDVLGRVNQAVAAEADRVVLVMAGLAVELPIGPRVAQGAARSRRTKNAKSVAPSRGVSRKMT